MAVYPALDVRYPPGPGTGVLQDLLYAELDAFEPIAIHEHETGDGWRVFFRTPALRDKAMSMLDGVAGKHPLEVSALDVEDEDWARRSQANLTAIRAGRITIAPPWDIPTDTAAPDDILIVIEPSMGFGTGHHATTRLCLQLLQQASVEGRQVIDVGTGSGVLALAAWKLGAAGIVAMDNDPDALLNARDNIERNGAAGSITVIESELAAWSIPPADVVTANLTGAVLVRHAAELRHLLAPPGTLIVSGFSPEELEDVTRALGPLTAGTLSEGEWAAAALRIS